MIYQAACRNVLCQLHFGKVAATDSLNESISANVLDIIRSLS